MLKKGLIKLAFVSAVLGGVMAPQKAAAQDIKSYDVFEKLAEQEAILFSKKMSKEEKIAAGHKIYDLQKDFIGFFGPGADIKIEFNHHGKRFVVPIDLDAGLLRFPFTTKPDGNTTTKLFRFYATQNLLNPVHSAIQGTSGALSTKQQEQEKRLAQQGERMWYSIWHKDSDMYRDHMLNAHDIDVKEIEKLILNAQIIDGTTYKSVSDFIREKLVELSQNKAQYVGKMKELNAQYDLGIQFK